MTAPISVPEQFASHQHSNIADYFALAADPAQGVEMFITPGKKGGSEVRFVHTEPVPDSEKQSVSMRVFRMASDGTALSSPLKEESDRLKKWRANIASIESMKDTPIYRGGLYFHELRGAKYNGRTTLRDAKGELLKPSSFEEVIRHLIVQKIGAMPPTSTKDELEKWLDKFIADNQLSAFKDKILPIAESAFLKRDEILAAKQKDENTVSSSKKKPSKKVRPEDVDDLRAIFADGESRGFKLTYIRSKPNKDGELVRVLERKVKLEDITDDVLSAVYAGSGKDVAEIQIQSGRASTYIKGNSYRIVTNNPLISFRSKKNPMLRHARMIIQDMKRKGYPDVAFNGPCSKEFIQAIMQAAKEEDMPVNMQSLKKQTVYDPALSKTVKRYVDEHESEEAQKLAAFRSALYSGKLRDQLEAGIAQKSDLSKQISPTAMHKTIEALPYASSEKETEAVLATIGNMLVGLKQDLVKDPATKNSMAIEIKKLRKGTESIAASEKNVPTQIIETMIDAHFPQIIDELRANGKDITAGNPQPKQPRPAPRSNPPTSTRPGIKLVYS